MRPPPANTSIKTTNKKAAAHHKPLLQTKDHQSLNRMIVHRYYTISVEMWQYKISGKVEFMYKEMDYGALEQELSSWLSHAGPNARREFMKEVDSRTHDHLSRFEERLEKGYITNLAADYSDSYTQTGDCFVYMFVDNNGEIYYVGMGDETRFQYPYGRSKEFDERYKKSKSKVILAAKWCTRAMAAEIERLVIWKCQLSGFRLVNKSEMLSSKELYELRHLSEDLNKETNLQSKYRWMKEDYPEVLSAFDKIEKWLYNGGASETSNYVNVKQKTTWAMECWTIDGVTKTRSQWCKENKVSASKANYRISLGCTPKEALTFPTAPDTKKRYQKNWWIENGYIPGSDKTSYITPYSEWPEDIKRCGVY